MISKNIIFLCLIACNFVSAQHKDFSLTGKTADIKDGTYLYFRDLVNGGDIDSAMVRNNNFRFNTELPEPTFYVMLFTKDRQNFTELWLEKTNMTFDASTVGFEDAEVTGSRNHSLYRIIKEEVQHNSHFTDTERHQKNLEYIKSNPDALVSAYLLQGDQRLEPHEIGEIFSSLSLEVQESSLGKRIAVRLEKDLPELGKPIIDFSLANTKDEFSKISDLKGKLTLLQFWSTSCNASKIMNVPLSEVYSRYHSEGFNIITISKGTSKENWIRALQENELSWPTVNNLIDSDNEVFSAYGINATPSNFLINNEGIIIARNLRDGDLNQKIEEELAD